MRKISQRSSDAGSGDNLGAIDRNDFGLFSIMKKATDITGSRYNIASSCLRI